MRLLILTQKVDQNDDVLGFFHGWIAEFAKHTEQVTVIALGVGEYHLPNNVRVCSLGKERGVSRLGYILNFYRFIWRERKNYDAVFVHMNQEYVLLGAFLWKLLGKKILMWRNHKKGSFVTRLAVALSNRVFCTSKFSYTARFKETMLMPVGIDTDVFKRNEAMARAPHSILFLGRISPVKNVNIFIEALKILDEKNASFVAHVYGDPITANDAYYGKVKEMARGLEQKRKIIFHAAVPNYKTPEVYNTHEIFVNITAAGSFDKTILEAMACETVALCSNDSLKGGVPEFLFVRQDDPADLARKLELLLRESPARLLETGKQERAYVAKHHTLSLLAEKLVRELAL